MPTCIGFCKESYALYEDGPEEQSEISEIGQVVDELGNIVDPMVALSLPTLVELDTPLGLTEIQELAAMDPAEMTTSERYKVMTYFKPRRGNT